MNKWFWVVIALIVCVVAGFLLYSGPEEKAQNAYDKAFAVEKTADTDQAMLLYDKLIAEYPGTEGAALAEKGRLRVFEMKEKRLKAQVRDQVARLLLALNGYQSMYGAMPATISVLDESEYFFDSDYLAEMIPKPFTTYLVLSADSSPKIWSLHADKDSVYTSSDQQGSLQRMSKADALQEIEAGYAEVVKKGQMVFLQKK